MLLEIKEEIGEHTELSKRLSRSSAENTYHCIGFRKQPRWTVSIVDIHIDSLKSLNMLDTIEVMNGRRVMF